MKKLILFATLILLALSCEEEKKLEFLSSETFDDYTELEKNSKKIVKSSFVMLSSELKSQMKTGGVAAAINGCNVKAPEIESKLSKTFKVKVRRTSNKVRSLENSPDAIDTRVLEYYLNNKNAEPELLNTTTNIRYYHPIKTKAMCLSCHGNVSTQIGEKNYSIIKKLYPKDEAIDYGVDEFRGLWVLEYEKK